MHHILNTIDIQRQFIHAINAHQLNFFQWIFVILPLFVFFVPYSSIVFIRVYVFIMQAYYFVIIYNLPILSAFAFVISVYIFFRIVYFRKYLKKPYIFLEITPPESTAQTPLATRELFTQLHSFSLPYKRWWRFVIPTPKTVYSLELVATKKQGIRYIIRIPKDDETVVKKAFYSYLPNIRIKQTTDPLPIQKNTLQVNGWWSFSEMILGNHFAYPLSIQTQLPQHDPIAYITGNMTKLADNELVAMQLLITPINRLTHNTIVKHINTIFNAIWREESIGELLHKNHIKDTVFFIVFLPVRIIEKILCFYLDLFLSPIWIFFFIFSLGKTRLFPFTFPIKRSQQIKLTTEQKKLHENVQEKLEQELFETNCRFLVVSQKGNELDSRGKGLVSSLATFTNDPYQGFILKRELPFQEINNKINIFRLHHRLLACINNPIISVTDLANMYHPPYTDTTKTEDLIKAKTKYLPLPLKLKNEENFNTVFAENRHDGQIYKIGLTRDERRRHVYILGATGTGKTTLLKSMIMDDREADEAKGFCVIDPHGDLINSLLLSITDDGRWGTILFDPSDIENPVGINLLELPKGLSESELTKEKDRIAASLISIFTKLYPPNAMGYRMENVLRIATLTALETEEPTIFTIQQLLTNTKYRNSVVKKLKDPVLSSYWINEFNKMGSLQRTPLISPITNKIGRFIMSPFSRYILGQKKSTIDFDEIINERGILLCNLAKGQIGEDISTLFGGIITAKLQLAALKRVKIPENERNDFYLYIDEFQNFATTSFAQIMSEARKYRLNAILAHQTTAQIEDKNLLNVIIANTGTIITFRTGSPEDEDFILPHFAPFISKGELRNLPSFEFYMKISAIQPTDPFSGDVTPYVDCQCCDEDAEKEVREGNKEFIVKQSRERYTRKKEDIEKEIQTYYSDTQTNESTEEQKPQIDDEKSILPD